MNYLKSLYLRALVTKYFEKPNKKPLTLKQYRCFVKTPLKFIHKYLEQGNLL